jgi:predicted MPP superfamily phosphohydrolase
MLWRLCLLVARGVAALGRRWAGVERPKATASGHTGSRDGEAAPWSRREFLRTATALTPPLLTLGAAGWSEFQLDDFRVRRMDVTLRGLPAALDGVTIAHVSDTHVGRLTRGRVLEKIVETVNGLQADMIAITGDLINDSLRALPPALEMVRAFRAREVVVACEGNHDLIENPGRFRSEAEKGGLPLLRDAAATVTIRGQKVQILGIRWEGQAARMAASTRELLARRDAGAWPLLLAHHPHAWDAAQDAAGEDVPLTLAGHTHGGQLMLGPNRPIFPGMFRYWSGIYRRERSALVVSNGVGNWFPLRINAPAEVVHLTLRRAG